VRHGLRHACVPIQNACHPVIPSSRPAGKSWPQPAGKAGGEGEFAAARAVRPAPGGIGPGLDRLVQHGAACWRGPGIGLRAVCAVTVPGVTWIAASVHACGHSTVAGTPICSTGPAWLTAAAWRWPFRNQDWPVEAGGALGHVAEVAQVARVSQPGGAEPVLLAEHG